MVNESQEVNSCPLFTDGTERQKEKDNNGNKALQNNISSHWLFAKINVPVNDNSTTKKEERVTIESLEKDFQLFVTKLGKQKKEISTLQSFETISSEVSVLSTDNVEYLFKDDTVSYKRNINLNCFSQLEKVQETKQNVKVSANLSTSARLHLSRKAKNIESYFGASNVIFDEEEDDNDEDGGEAFDKSCKRKPENKIEKLFKQPVKRLKQADNREQNYVNLSSDDEEADPVVSEIDVAATNNDVTDKPGKFQKITSIIRNPSKILEYLTPSRTEEPEQPKETNSIPLKNQVECPMCNRMFSKTEINNHAFDCQGPVETRVTRGSSKSSKNAAASYGPWANACQKIDRATEMKARKRNDNLNNDSDMEIDSNPIVFSTKDKKVKNSYAGYFAKKNRKKPSGVYSLSEDDEKDIFESYCPNDNFKIPKKSYSKTKESTNFLNESQDDGFLKCGKCEQKFPEDKYSKHTEECLEDSRIN